MTREPISLPGRTVIFDYGEVISLSQSQADRAALERLAGAGDGAATARFWAAYHAHRDGLDQGTGGVAAYWRAVAADIGASWDEGRVHELWAADFRSWLSVNPDVIDLLTDLRSGGTSLALLSNAGPDYGSYFRHGPLGDFFAACYVSGELGLLKPHPEIYRHVLGDLGIAPAEAVFIDNRAPNVAGAQALGITGHLFTGAGALRAFLSALTAPASDLDAARHHAELRRHPEGGFEIIDLGSRNGTYVNGERITRKTLTEHDVIRVGDATFRLVSGELLPYPGASPVRGEPG